METASKVDDSLYSPLEHAFSFRLIELLENEESDRIQTRLIQTTLSPVTFGTPPIAYEAISYTWESQSQDREIICNDKPLLVTQNCHDALDKLRSRPYRLKHFWIDSLCIDQSSTTDRNHQVRLMGEIYKNARRVVVWLGTEDSWSQLAFKFIRTFASLKQEQAARLWMDNMTQPHSTGTRHMSALELNLRNEYHTLVRETAEEELEAMEKHYIRPQVPREFPRIQSLYELLNRPWFQRMWTVQEVALAKECLVVCGMDSCSWNSLVDAVQALETLEDYKALSMPLLGHIHAKIGLEKANLHHSKVGAPLVGGHELLTLFNSCRSKLCTDPKDKVFALFGLLQSQKYKIYEPDYSKSVEEVYMNIARFILEAELDSSMLLYAAHHPARVSFCSNLPSWVPDWSDTGQDEFLRTFSRDGYLASPETWQLLGFEPMVYSACGRRSGGTFEIIDRGRTLTLYASEVDTIRAAKYFPTLKEGRSRADEMDIHDRSFPEAITNGIDLIGIDWESLIPFLNLCLDAVDMSRTENSQHPLLELCEPTIKNGFYENKLKPMFEHWRYFITESNHYDNLCRYDWRGPCVNPTATNISAHNKCGLNFVETIIRNYGFEDLTVEPQWSTLFASLKRKHGQMGLKIMGDNDATEFQLLMQDILGGRMVYVTTEGRLGITPMLVHEEDRVALIEGLQVPLVLRPQTSPPDNLSGNYYSLVGQTYLAGAMYGELWAKATARLKKIALYAVEPWQQYGMRASYRYLNALDF